MSLPLRRVIGVVPNGNLTLGKNNTILCSSRIFQDNEKVVAFIAALSPGCNCY